MMMRMMLKKPTQLTQPTRLIQPTILMTHIIMKVFTGIGHGLGGQMIARKLMKLTRPTQLT
jgi:hypothetical protein